MALDFTSLSCYNAAMTLTPQQVLAAAADDCEKNWCQVSMQDKNGRHCMLGAINVAAGVPAVMYSLEGMSIVPTERKRLRNAACQLLIDKGIISSLITKMESTRYEYDFEELLVMSVYSFNDRNDQATVVAALRKGAE